MIQRNVQETHLGVSGVSADSERSDKTNNSSSYSAFEGAHVIDLQERLQNIEEFNVPPRDYDDDTDKNEGERNFREHPIPPSSLLVQKQKHNVRETQRDMQNVPGVRNLCISNQFGCSNGTQQSGSSYDSVHSVQHGKGQASGLHQFQYCPRGHRYNDATFRGQPSQYHGRGHCAQYDNAPNIRWREGLRVSNLSGGSSSTQPPYYTYLPPWSIQSSSRGGQPPSLPPTRGRYHVLEPGLNPRHTVNDQFELKKKSCSIRKACKYTIWTAIFLGISFGVALSTFNNLNANDLEKQMIEGNNKINETFASSFRMFDASFDKVRESVRNDSQTLHDKTSNIRNETETSIRELKTISFELFEEFKMNNDSLNEAIESVRHDSRILRNETISLQNKTETSIKELKTMSLELFGEFKMYNDSLNAVMDSVGYDSQILRNETRKLRNETETSIQELKKMSFELFEEFKMYNDSLNEALDTVRTDSQILRNETISLRNETETSILEFKTMMLELFEEFKRNITSYCTNGPCSGNPGNGSGSGSGGQCYNTTTNGCVDQCDNMCDGDYQSCATCKGYVTCANRILWHRNCSTSHLVWDDHIKRCESASSTCF